MLMSPKQKRVKTIVPGDEIANFILESVDILDDYHGYGYLFRHRISGMQVYHIANDDKENFFSFIFKTPPHDDCGAPHIIEHSILAGSKNYPLKDPFMSLLKGSAQTFMNAMTYPDFTVYPAASAVQKDFRNLFSVYADAVFNPLLREQTFWQEGIRLEADGDGSLHFDGVVYNEMLGELSDHDSIVSRQSIRSLYPDTPYYFESGGDPRSIVNLTYSKFVSFYSTYYHPSNAKLFLYGNLDPAEYLEYLDDHYLVDISRKCECGPSEMAGAWKNEREVVAYAPSLDTNTDENNASVTVSWATTAVEDPVEVVTLTLLTDILLGNPGAPLYKAIIDSQLAKDISQVSGMDTSFRQMPFTVGFRGIHPDDAEKAKQLVLDTLAKLVKEGIDPSLVENAIRRQEFLLQEISGSNPMGLRAMNRCVRGWLQGKEPHVSLKISEALAVVKEKVLETSANPEYLFAKKDHPQGYSYFEQWIDTNLLKNCHRCTLIVKGDSSFQSALQNSLDKRIEAIKEEMGEEGIDTIREQNRQFSLFQKTADSPEALQTIPRLSKDDVNEPVKHFDTRTISVDSVPLHVQTMESNGILYLDGMIHVEDLSEEEMLNVPILTRMLHMVGIRNHSYSEFAKRVRKHTGGLSFFMEGGSLLKNQSEAIIAVAFRMKCLQREYPQALILLRDLFTQAQVDDPERVTAVIKDMRSDFESNVSSSAHMFAAQRASKNFSSILSFNELAGGIQMWDYLQNISLNDEKEVARIGRSLRALFEKIMVRNRFVLHLLTDEKSSEKMSTYTCDFISRLPENDFYPHLLNNQLRQGLFDDSEFFCIPSSVSFNSLVFPSASPFEKDQAHQSILMYILSTNHLWEKVRGAGGAYGISGHVDMLERLCTFQSYRDPRISGTYQDIFESLRQIAEDGVGQNLVDNAIITIISRELKPQYPQRAAIVDFRRTLYDISDEFRTMRREFLLGTTSDDVRKAAQLMIDSLSYQKSSVAIAGAEIFDKEKDSSMLRDKPVTTLPV